MVSFKKFAVLDVLSSVRQIDAGMFVINSAFCKWLAVLIISKLFIHWSHLMQLVMSWLLHCIVFAVIDQKLLLHVALWYSKQKHSWSIVKVPIVLPCRGFWFQTQTLGLQWSPWCPLLGVWCDCKKTFPECSFSCCRVSQCNQGIWLNIYYLALYEVSVDLSRFSYLLIRLCSSSAWFLEATSFHLWATRKTYLVTWPGNLLFEI